MKSFVKYLGCGNYNKKSNKKVGEFQCSKFSDISEKIIPFFKKHQIRGVKAQDWEDWCIVAELIKNKAHLTSEGLDEIKKIKFRMNRGRSATSIDS